MISDDCAKLSQLKEELALHADLLIKQTAVNPIKVSKYCLSAISFWNNAYPRRQIPISERIVSSDISDGKCKSASKVLRTL